MDARPRTKGSQAYGCTHADHSPQACRTNTLRQPAQRTPLHHDAATSRLIVEDDTQLGDAIATGLRQQGHAVDWFRDGEQANSAMAHGALSFDPATRRVMGQHRHVDLTGRELALLEALLKHPQRVLSNRQLQEQIYDWSGNEPESNALEVHVHHLGRKIHPDAVRTVRGVGYALGPVA